MTTQLSFRFPGSVNTIHQNGRALTTPREGVNVQLHYREDAATPHCAEVYSDDQEEYAELGLWFEGNTLSDQDGSFSLPREVAIALEYMGLIVPQEFKD